MDVKFNVTGSERKALVGAVSEILGWEAVYKGAPTFAYAVNDYLIDKNGTLSCPADAGREEIDQLTTALKERGYVADAQDGADSDDSHKLVIEMPEEGFTDEAIGNLRKIIASKEALIKKALGADSLPIERIDGKLRFQWFTPQGITGEGDAYTRLICALCNMAKTKKRVTAKEKTVENDKFTMRLFLIRLGFVGPEYKTARAILLKNLSGNGSFKSGERRQKDETVPTEETGVS